jgi:thiol-disulfide isomerase/thioredoxin
LLLFCLGVAKPGGAIPGPYCLRVGKDARSTVVVFTLPGLDGAPVTVTSASGKSMLVSIFATWCGPCKRELPSLLEVAHRYAPQGLTTILVDLKEKPDKVRAFATANGIDVPVLIDADGSVSRIYGLHGIPSDVFYNDQGVMTCLNSGFLLPKDLDNEASSATGGWTP